MLDFTKIENAIMDDLKLICTKQYLLLNTLGLPKEVNLMIIYNRLCLSDELSSLKTDMTYSHKEALHLLFYACLREDIDLSDYEKQLTLRIGHLSMGYQPNRKSQSNHFIDKLYESNNHIFDIIIVKYLSAGYMDKEEYRSHYIMNKDWYVEQLTIPEKYKPLLEIKLL